MFGLKVARATNNRLLLFENVTFSETLFQNELSNAYAMLFILKTGVTPQW